MKRLLRLPKRHSFIELQEDTAATPLFFKVKRVVRAPLRCVSKFRAWQFRLSALEFFLILMVLVFSSMWVLQQFQPEAAVQKESVSNQILKEQGAQASLAFLAFHFLIFSAYTLNKKKNSVDYSQGGMTK